MALREKSAWVSFWTTLIVYGGYVAYVGKMAIEGRSLGFAGPLAACILVLVVLQVGLQIALAALSREPRTAQDERERLIDLEASTRAFYVLQVAAMGAAITVYFADKTLMAHAVILALAVSELTRHGGIILGYRRAG
ncbi:MAG: hypothetical protein H7236_06085 [Gemmatimonadaceae bacterium]|nr:hypothetical protein [Caulobacter sp.]